MAQSSFAKAVLASLLIVAVASIIYANLSNEPSEAAQQITSAFEIAFSQVIDGNEDIYAIDTQGSVKRITSEPSAEFLPTWSPDRSRIAFVSTRNHSTGDIYVMNADGSDWVQLTSNADVDTMPVWSRDGLRVAFLSSRWDVNATRGLDDSMLELHIMNADGSKARRLTNTSGRVLASKPVQWTRDGKYITFAYQRTGDPLNYPGKADAQSGIIVDTPEPGAERPYIYLDPTSSKVAFELAPAEHPGTYIADIPSDKSQWVRVTTEPTTSLEWSPDGSALAFVTAQGEQALYVIGANGCCLEKLAAGVFHPQHFMAWAR